VSRTAFAFAYYCGLGPPIREGLGRTLIRSSLPGATVTMISRLMAWSARSNCRWRRWS